MQSGPPRYLTGQEEEELVNILIGCAALGYARSNNDVIALVQQVVATKGMEGELVTDGWWVSLDKDVET